MTAEDPVEFYMPGINQVNIRDEINLNFAAALRAFLRQDPDIMLVGEMRDHETVDIAIKAALTGHLVFSTIHTNDSASTVHRLHEHEHRAVPDRRLGHPHRRPAAGPQGLQESAASRPSSRPRPCSTWASRPRRPNRSPSCRAAAARPATTPATRAGRRLFEVMEITPAIREMILLRAQSKDIKKKAIEQGMITMRRSGLIKIKAGITTIEEVVRETVKD